MNLYEENIRFGLVVSHSDRQKHDKNLEIYLWLNIVKLHGSQPLFNRSIYALWADEHRAERATIAPSVRHI